MRRRRTAGRGLRLWGSFKDSHGNRVRVQESSAAGSTCVWIFCARTKPDAGDFPPHLNRTSARRLRAALDRYLEDTDPYVGTRKP